MSESAQEMNSGNRGALQLPYSAGRIQSTFPLDTPDGRKRMHNLLHGDKQTMKESVGKEIRLTDIVVCPRENILPTGEVKEWTEYILVSDSGEAFTSGSEYVADCVRSVLSLCGVPPWSEPVTLVVRKRPTTGGKEMLYLVIA